MIDCDVPFLDDGARFAAVIREISKSPLDVLRRTAAEALGMCDAHSSGVSMLVDTGGGAILQRRAIVGTWAPYIGSTEHVDIAPDGAVVRTVALHAAALQLLTPPALELPHEQTFHPPATEMLAAPLGIHGRPAGSIWAVLHDKTRRFSHRDQCRLRDLAACAAAAYEVSLRGWSQAVACAPGLGVQGVPSLPNDEVGLESQPAHSRDLSPREREVCIGVALGRTNCSIAEALSISVKTVETYRSRVADKLDLCRREDFVRYALLRNWLTTMPATPLSSSRVLSGKARQRS